MLHAAGDKDACSQHAQVSWETNSFTSWMTLGQLSILAPFKPHFPLWKRREEQHQPGWVVWGSVRPWVWSTLPRAWCTGMLEWWSKETLIKDKKYPLLGVEKNMLRNKKKSSREGNISICSNMDGQREHSQARQRQILSDITYNWSRKNNTNIHNRNRLTDRENKILVTKEEKA